MKKQKNTSEVKGRNTRNSKARGSSYERKIVNELKELGFDVGTTRNNSREQDNNKIDIYDNTGTLPCYIQLKLTQATPNYFKIESECPLKDKPFVIIWSKTIPTEKTFRSVGEIAMIPKSFFYELIKSYYGK